MPTGTYQRPEDFSAEIKRRIAARKAKGLPFGRPRVYVIRHRHCKTCGTRFEYKKYPNAPHRRFCKQPCASKAAREARRKVPDDFGVMYDLYWEQGLSLWQIAQKFNTEHNTVRRRLVQLGIPRRIKRNTGKAVCIIEECGLACYKIEHSNNRSLYGRRCFVHWIAHRQHLAREYWERIAKWRKKDVDFLALIEAAVPKSMPPDIREEVCQEIALEVLTAKIQLADMKSKVSGLAKRFINEYQDKYRMVSLDAPIGNEEDGTTWADMLIG